MIRHPPFWDHFDFLSSTLSTPVCGHPRNHSVNLHPTLSPAAFLLLSPSYRSSPHSSFSYLPPARPLLLLRLASHVRDHRPALSPLFLLLSLFLARPRSRAWAQIHLSKTTFGPALDKLLYLAQRWFVDHRRTSVIIFSQFSLLKSQSPLSLRQNTSTLCLESSFFISVVVDALSSSFNPILTIFTALSTIVLAPKYLPHTSTHLISDSLLESSRRCSNNAIPSPVLPINPNSQPASKAHRSSATRYSQPTRLRFGLFKNGRWLVIDCTDEAERAQAELCLCAATLRCFCYSKLREPGDSRDTNLLPRLSNGKSLTLDTRHRGRRIDDAFYELLPLELPHSYFDRKNSARLNVLSNIDQLSRITGIDIYNDKSYNRAAVWFLHSRMSKPLGSGQFQTILEEIANQMDRLKPPAAISETGLAQSHSNTASGDDLTTFIPYHPTDPPNHPQLPIPAGPLTFIPYHPPDQPHHLTSTNDALPAIPDHAASSTSNQPHLPSAANGASTGAPNHAARITPDHPTHHPGLDSASTHSSNLEAAITKGQAHHLSVDGVSATTNIPNLAPKTTQDGAHHLSMNTGKPNHVVQDNPGVPNRERISLADILD
ncbi:hypothetical protein EV361DRAFT_945663 [Lentinula raphanica]|nr:hypothetical protein EV361DRAFT_945663 [Lentinula raphanica]